MLSRSAERAARVVPLVLALLLVCPASPQGCGIYYPQITTPSPLPAGALGVAFSQLLAATDVGNSSYAFTWRLASGSLPAGLTLSSIGVISGAPSATGTFSFVVSATDLCGYIAQKQFTLTICPGPLGIAASSALPSGATGTTYSQLLSACCGTPPYLWALEAGTLPTGLALSSSGAITGTPTAAGTSTFTATVTDATSATASQPFTLTVNLSPLAISTASPLPPGVAGTAYSQTLTAAGGVSPYTWQLTSGSLPPLLTLSSTGVISGVPATPGFSAFTITVTDSASHTTSQAFSLTITLGPLAITTLATLPVGVVGASYSQTLAATGGVPPYTWQVKLGAWPPGLVFSSGGAITGAPSQVGSFSFTVQATDSSSASVSRVFTLLVSAPGCASSLNYSGQAFGAPGGSGTVNVTAPSSCQWTASSQLSWVGITAGASGIGSGAVTFLVAANSGAARSGSLAIAGFPFTVEQTAASTSGLSVIGSLPHVTSGGYWDDTITLINNGNAGEEALVSFYDDNGNPFVLPVNFPQAPLSAPLLASSVDRTVNAGAELLIETVGPDDQPALGGWALVQASGSLTGQSLFRWGAPPSQQEAAAQLETRSPGAFLLSFDQTGGYVLGVAVANASPAAANILAELVDDGGALLAATTIPLPAMGHTAFMLSDKFPAAAQRRGTLVLTVPTGGQISTLAFRANTSGSLASVLPLVK